MREKLKGIKKTKIEKDTAKTQKKIVELRKKLFEKIRERRLFLN